MRWVYLMNDMKQPVVYDVGYLLNYVKKPVVYEVGLLNE